MVEDLNTAKNDELPASHDAREGNCMLLALQHQNMLVPRNIVAEVIRLSVLRFIRDQHSGLDFFEWRGHKVPLLGSSMLGEAHAVECTDDSKVAVLYGLRSQEQLPYYGITIARSPRLLRLSENDLEHIAGVQLHSGEVMRVRMDQGEAFIPKVDYFESLTIELLKQQQDG